MCILSLILKKKKHPTEIKFQYIFSNLLVKNFVGKKGRNLSQETKIFTDEVFTDKVTCWLLVSLQLVTFICRDMK